VWAVHPEPRDPPSIWAASGPGAGNLRNVSVHPSSAHRRASVAEALAFVAAHPHVFLLATRPDGYPTGYAMMARVRDGFVDFSTYGTSAKVKNLLRDGVAGLLAFSDERNLAASVLFATGPVTAMDGASWMETAHVPTSSGVERFTAHVPARITEEVRERHESGKRIVLRMSVERARFSSAPEGDR
jgi:hypothetical protein